VKILRIEKKNPFKDIYTLIFDNGSLCKVTSNEILEYKISKGLEINDDDLKSIKHSSSISLLKNSCIGYLAIRPRSKLEISQYIQKKFSNNYSDESEKEKILQTVIKYLECKFLIDDQEFARWYLEKSINLKSPKSKNQIKYDLVRKGINNSIINETLKIMTKENEFDIAILMAEKKLLSLNRKNLSKKDRNLKLLQYLYTKGFNYSTCRTAVDSINSKN
jgi:regulatory protein